jgi:glycosyltransferase involved in cell wall biosynthesis
MNKHAGGVKMQQNPIRVLNVLGTIDLGGAESRVMELYRALERDKVQFDFLIHNDVNGHYSKEIKTLGGKIYSVPRFKVTNYFTYKKALETFFKEHNDYAAVQGHMTSTASIYLPIAKKAGVPITIAHARSAGVDQGIRGIVTRIIRYPLKNRADFLFTCSKEAGVAVYGKKAVKDGKVITIPNAIDADRFSYNEKVRNEVRKELGISDKFVIGHVGRFGFMKNHAYLLDIFNEICKQRKDTVLVLIGEGGLMGDIKAKAESLGLKDKVYFLGNRSDIERYYQAFDYFVFPSTFEGFPGSVAEAQASGLSCLVSDKITREVALTELVTYKSIDETPKSWADEIFKNADKTKVRKDHSDIIKEKNFDVKRQAQMLEKFYKTGQNPPGTIIRNRICTEGKFAER